MDAELLAHDLLPGWEEEWLTGERAHFRQGRLHALDALCYRLSSRRRCAEAVLIGQQAVAEDPLRETAQAALIRAYLDEGNRIDAHRQYSQYVSLLQTEIGEKPSEFIRSLIGDAIVPR